MNVAGRRVAFLGGDRRMTEAALALAQQGVWVRATGLPGEVAAPGLTRCGGAEEALSGAEAAILPVQPVGEDGRVQTEPGIPTLYLRSGALDRLAAGALIMAGLAGPWLRQEARARGFRLIEYRDRDDFAIYNSVPSAEGAIAMAMQASPLCLFDNHALVLGYGRTGITLARMLAGIGARVTVAARGETDLARIYAAGHRPLEFPRLAEAVAEADFIFNTVPARVLTRDVLAMAPGHLVIIDLASAPGGTDFGAADELGLTARLAPGLPGQVAPVTAGRLIASLVVRYLATAGGPPTGRPAGGGAIR